MCFVVPDELLRAANLTEREMLVEVVCLLFDKQKIYKQDGCRVLGLTRVEFEAELYKRGLAVYHYTREMWEEDLRTLKALDESGFWHRDKKGA